MLVAGYFANYPNQDFKYYVRKRLGGALLNSQTLKVLRISDQTERKGWIS